MRRPKAARVLRYIADAQCANGEFQLGPSAITAALPV